METLEEIIKKERKINVQEGEYGMIACKRAILSTLETNKLCNQRYCCSYPTSLFSLLEQYYERSQKERFFNKRMILACWELINKKEGFCNE